MLQQAVAHHQAGRLAQAEALYELILVEQPGHFDALHLLGVVASNRGDPQRALLLLERAIQIDAGNAAAHFNRGTALQSLGRWQEALACYERAVLIEPRFADALSNRAVIHTRLGRWAEALQSCDRAIDIAPGHAAAHFNRGNVSVHLRRWSAALADYGRALALSPNYPEAHFNRGNVHREMARWPDALLDFDRAIALRPAYASAYFSRGNVLREMKHMEAALDSYRCAARLNPQLEFLLGELLMTQLQICDWNDLGEGMAALRTKLERGEAAANPFIVLALFNSPALQRSAAAIWSIANHPAPTSSPPASSLPHTVTISDARLRIGYFSADFHEHATAQLIAGLFEAHDRGRFEVTAFSFGPDSVDRMRRRLVAATDAFIDVRHESDADVAELARRLKIDIAVDLKGYTQDNRAGIFARRAAPLQVSFLGYPGTMGASYMDYLIADRCVVSAGSEQHYVEKLVYIPDCYQVNDAQRPIDTRVFSRTDLGLPPGFVYCCFNNNYKILPETFDCWMRILRRVAGSVLWLLEDNPLAARNLRREAVRRGVDPQRLVFAPRLGLPLHLARHRAADLFLDTWPCNAHTTASDALWAALPVLTLAGETFASRVAASVLCAVDLPRLVASNVDDYETLAVHFAEDPAQLAEIKKRLQANLLTSRLFDCQKYARHLEAAFEAMHTMHRAGHPPEHILVGG